MWEVDVNLAFSTHRTILFQELRQIYPLLINQAPLSLQQEHLLVNNLIHGDTELDNDFTLLAVTLIFIDNSKGFSWFITTLDLQTSLSLTKLKQYYLLSGLPPLPKVLRDSNCNNCSILLNVLGFYVRYMYANVWSLHVWVH